MGMDRGAHGVTLVLTLILQLEAWPVLGVVAVEIHGGLVGRGEQGARKLASAESAHHAAGLVGAIPDFYEVMVGLGGEVQELDVSSWEQDRGRQCPKQQRPASNVPPTKALPARAPRVPATDFPANLNFQRALWVLPVQASLLSSGRTALKCAVHSKGKVSVLSELHLESILFY